jgi:small subunit ribosomal protein S20
MPRRLINQEYSTMPRTASAAKQARASLRRQAHNRAIKSKVHTLENRLLALVAQKKADEAAAAYRLISSALDKAAKTKVIHRNLASRKKSRLAARLKALAA